MLARSFLIESSSKLLVTRTGIKAWLSSILGRIRPLILELLALEWRKFHTFELEYLWSQLANLDQILCVASLGWGKGCIRWPDWPWHIGLRWAIVALWATCLVVPFVCFPTSCAWIAKALARLPRCAGSPEPLLVAYVISTIISWACSFCTYSPRWSNLLTKFCEYLVIFVYIVVLTVLQQPIFPENLFLTEFVWFSKSHTKIKGFLLL